MGHWTSQAACRDHPTNLWFPSLDDPDNHGRQAKTICAGCPVRLDCLVDALRRHEDGGIWGGAGEDIRRSLERALPTATHDPAVVPQVCGCGWCAAVTVHFAGLDGARVAVNRNGPGATHGRRVTYARGCRCGACQFAVQLYGAEEKYTQRRSTA